MLNMDIDGEERRYADQMCFVIECWGRRLRFLQENGIDITSIREYTLEDLLLSKAQQWWRERRDIVYKNKIMRG
jgi:hypothetical protein